MSCKIPKTIPSQVYCLVDLFFFFQDMKSKIQCVYYWLQLIYELEKMIRQKHKYNKKDKVLKLDCRNITTTSWKRYIKTRSVLH